MERKPPPQFANNLPAIFFKIIPTNENLNTLYAQKLVIIMGRPLANKSGLCGEPGKQGRLPKGGCGYRDEHCGREFHDGEERQKEGD